MHVDDVHRMARRFRDGVITLKPEVGLNGNVECDEVYVVAGHKGHPDAGKKALGITASTFSYRSVWNPVNSRKL